MTILTLTKVDVGMMEDVGTSANQIIQLDSNGKIPAVDGSLLTGIVAGVIGSSDPTISTNPSGGVGTKFTNTTDGEIFICTDATAGENVWKNVGEGSGNVVPYVYQGSSYGYSMGGYHYSDGVAPYRRGGHPNIDKWSYASGVQNATDAGDLTVARSNMCGVTSTTHGYACGGDGWIDVIDKFTTASDANATDVGNMAVVIGSNAGTQY